MTTILIDGDILVYQVASACQTAPIDWGEGIYSPATADLNEATGRLRAAILSIKNGSGADRVAIALKDSENFRKKIYPGYKANRNPAATPMLRAPLMKWLREEKAKHVWSRPGLEGDDVIGILATSNVIIPGEKLIWSIDKDIKQIPGYHWTPDGVQTVTEEEGKYLFYLQTLTGDATDHYPGCPGVGPKKAAQILSAAHSARLEADCVLSYERLMWIAVDETYKAKGLSTDAALTMARVARVLRNTDYDFKRKEPILWSPPTI